MGNASTRPPEDDIRHPQLVANAPADLDAGQHMAADQTEQLSDDDDINLLSSEESLDMETKAGRSAATEIQHSSPIKSTGTMSPVVSPSFTAMPSALSRKRSKRLETQSCQALLQENQQLLEAIAAELSLQAFIKNETIKKGLKITRLENKLAKIKNEISH